MDLAKKQVLVFGTGLSGIGAAKLLESVQADPILYDSNSDRKGRMSGKAGARSRARIMTGKIAGFTGRQSGSGGFKPGECPQTFLWWRNSEKKHPHLGERWSWPMPMERGTCWRSPGQMERLPPQACWEQS